MAEEQRVTIPRVKLGSQGLEVKKPISPLSLCFFSIIESVIFMIYHMAICIHMMFLILV
jgi:hypothetical protein